MPAYKWYYLICLLKFIPNIGLNYSKNECSNVVLLGIAKELHNNCDVTLKALQVPAKMHPADHISIDVEYSLAPNNTSGGLYHSVTTFKTHQFFKTTLLLIISHTGFLYIISL